MDDKEIFLQDEIWLVTISAAFQRANVFVPNPDELRKEALKKMVRGYIDNTILYNYHHDIIDDQHIENIYQIQDYSKNFRDILTNGSFSFGVSQKILNLYLKFQWCLGRLKSIPPHFPVDRRIQKELSLPKIVAWTRDMEEEEYLNVINYAREKLNYYKKDNIAELELYLFKRRGSI